MFSSLPRSDQRATGGLYLRGLMLDGRRKSMQPMAARLGVDHQRLQQFITNSPWDVAPVRRTLARLAIGVIQPEAWVIDDTGQAKEGTASACVARQVLRNAGQDRELSGRGQRPRGHRQGVGAVGLAAVHACELGRCGRGDRAGGRGDAGPRVNARSRTPSTTARSGAWHWR